MNALAPPIFVIGCFRGGTTLVERVLLAHPELTGPGFETQLFSRVRFGRPLDHSAKYATLTGVTPATSDPVEAFRIAVDELARRAGARSWVEKSPEHVYHAQAINARFPGARFVHVVRDPRDVVTSIMHTWWVVPRAQGRRARLVAGAVLWELMTFAGLRLLADASLAPVVLAVRYESLVNRPRMELERMAAFLGLPNDREALEDWLRRIEEVEANSLIEPDLTGIRTSPVGRWQDGRLLTAHELAVVQYLVGPTLARAGYDPVETERLSRVDRARAAAHKAAWLAVRAQRYSRKVGRGAPPHIAQDAKAALVPLVRPQAPGR